MENKIQELTQRLYNEGLAKGKEDASKVVEQAQSQAETIIADAKAQAEAIVAAARKEAEAVSKRCEADLKLASQQALATLKSQIESLILTKSAGKAVAGALSDGSTVKDMLVAVAKAFDAADAAPKGLEVILPETFQKDLLAKAESEVKAVLTSGIEIKTSPALSAGFKVAPKDGGYQISFSGEDLECILKEYLRPATKELLFS
ncbi:MAG: hypothetical protein HUJ89_01615 [Bacteroidales bacterium]|nr:hypothetical protein [Bacteroidales bacterium]